MTCKVLIFGLVLLAVFLPLVAPGLVVFVLDAPAVAGDASAFAGRSAQSVAVLDVTFLRGPPSR